MDWLVWALIAFLCIAVVFLGAVLSVLLVRSEQDRKMVDMSNRQMRDLHGRVSTIERDLGLDSSISTWRRKPEGA